MTDNQAGEWSALRSTVISALAEVRATSFEELDAELGRGETEVDSKEAEVVISIMSENLGRDLPQVEDLPRGTRLTVDVLAAHLSGSTT